jgi:hypothetical protein
MSYVETYTIHPYPTTDGAREAEPRRERTAVTIGPAVIPAPTRRENRHTVPPKPHGED